MMDIMRNRHSVRSYTDKAIPMDIRAVLQKETAQCNAESGMNIQLVWDEPEAFSDARVSYGRVLGVKNYIALVGKTADDLWENAGYLGERLVLKAAELGLHSCWVALTFDREACDRLIGDGEELVCVIAIGYGENAGVPHPDKPIEQLCYAKVEMTDWFKCGLEAAMLAPTARNQQAFKLTLLADNKVKIEPTESDFAKYWWLDIGIVRYHFEQGAGKDNFSWAE